MHPFKLVIPDVVSATIPIHVLTSNSYLSFSHEVKQAPIFMFVDLTLTQGPLTLTQEPILEEILSC